ncbi:MAG: right-handed parallel beta-helix repeat-containing protein [Lachnospiraceae bacterium]|nr:right-handed parallel beta-helix repeat-containing protein [Lachnospiraceae bacterium]
MDSLFVYPAPKGVPMLRDYRVRVRIKGQEWKELDTYMAKIDMHHVREVSVAYFDFSGRVECEVESLKEEIITAQVRPVAAGVVLEQEGNIIRFFLTKPTKLSVEINGNRFNNLHLFAGAVQETDEAIAAKKEPGRKRGTWQQQETQKATVIEPSGEELDLRAVIDAAGLSGGRHTVFLSPGLHRLKDNICTLPSDTTILLAGGTVVMGSFLIEGQCNVTVAGKGIIYLGHVKKQTFLRGVDIRFSENVSVEGVTILNPAHYSIHLGSSSNVLIRDVKAFSCEGWSDGIDMMACENIRIEDVFLRNSDDCIAVYGGRFEFPGNTRNVVVKDAVLWADVAHPTMVGVHGDAKDGGSIIENISFENIDILEHHEPQDDYLGCMAVNVGDGNTVRNLSYKNIRVEPFERGKLLDLQVKWNKKYNDIPGQAIKNVVFEDIFYSGDGEHTSEIKGFSQERRVEGVRFKNLVVRGVKVKKPEDGNIHIGEFAGDIHFE